MNESLREFGRSVNEVSDLVAVLREMLGQELEGVDEIVNGIWEDSSEGDVDPIKKLPGVLHADRCLNKAKEPSKKVLVTFQGKRPPFVDIPTWGKYYTEVFTPEPLRCFKCQRFGHHQQECTAKPICGVCSGKHPTRDCIDKHKKKEATTARCPNCHKGHHAWYKGCMERLKRIWNMKGSHPPTTAQPNHTQYTSHSQPPTTQQEPQRELAKQWQQATQQHTHKPPQSHRPQHYQQTHKTGQSQKTQHHQPPTQKQQATPTTPHENRDPRLTEGTLYTQRNTQVPNARPTSFLPYSTPKQPLLPTPAIPPNMPSSSHPVHESNTRTGSQGYTVYKTPHTNENRGLITLVKATIPSEKIRNIDCGQGIETLSIQIRLENTSLVIHNIYKGHDKILEGENLFSAASRENTFFAGDFNAHHPCLRSQQHTNAAGRHIHLLLEEFPEVALLNDTNEATHLRGGRLDLSFVSQNLKEECAWKVHPILTSDHFATETSIKITKIPPPPPPPAGWRPDLANWPTFENRMTEWATQYLQTPAQNINTPQEDFVSSLHNAANNMPKTFTTNQTPHKDSWYYNTRIKEMNSRVNRTRKLFRRNPTDEMHALLREVINHATQTAKEVKQETWLKWCSQTPDLLPLQKCSNGSTKYQENPR
ncbi:uncharacterized protein LOC135214537 [Macrobrachium nipponense]|uniref:uncharacterized protein LOC135214537 n=1 Tax=Macrobrachium nipponense TaxID=159736 RepID=UPI0030C7CF28